MIAVHTNYQPKDKVIFYRVRMSRGFGALSLSSIEKPVYSMMSFGPLYNYIIASHEYNENNKA